MTILSSSDVHPNLYELVCTPNNPQENPHSLLTHFFSYILYKQDLLKDIYTDLLISLYLYILGINVE